MDAFAVAISTGLNNGRMKTARVLRLSFAFGLFHY
jgi:putative Mn2+ efflux pump MntP